jgi:hypothetical protein
VRYLGYIFSMADAILLIAAFGVLAWAFDDFFVSSLSSSISAFVDDANMAMPSIWRTPALAFKSDEIARNATRFPQPGASVAPP